MKEETSQERVTTRKQEEELYEKQITLPSTPASILLASNESDTELNDPEQDLSNVEQFEFSSSPVIKKKRS